MASRIVIILTIIGGVFLALMLSPAWQTSTANITQQCDQVLANVEGQESRQLCEAPSKQVSWHTWATGQSRSTQFHFLDLVELVFGERMQQGSNESTKPKKYSSSL